MRKYIKITLLFLFLLVVIIYILLFKEKGKLDRQANALFPKEYLALFKTNCRPHLHEEEFFDKGFSFCNFSYGEKSQVEYSILLFKIKVSDTFQLKSIDIEDWPSGQIIYGEDNVRESYLFNYSLTDIKINSVHLKGIQPNQVVKNNTFIYFSCHLKRIAVMLNSNYVANLFLSPYNTNDDIFIELAIEKHNDFLYFVIMNPNYPKNAESKKLLNILDI